MQHRRFAPHAVQSHLLHQMSPHAIISVPQLPPARRRERLLRVRPLPLRRRLLLAVCEDVGEVDVGCVEHDAAVGVGYAGSALDVVAVEKAGVVLMALEKTATGARSEALRIFAPSQLVTSLLELINLSALYVMHPKRAFSARRFAALTANICTFSARRFAPRSSPHLSRPLSSLNHVS